MGAAIHKCCVSQKMAVAPTPDYIVKTTRKSRVDAGRMSLHSVFSAWRIVGLVARVRRFESTLIFQDEKLAQMTTENQELQATASRALEFMQTQTSNSVRSTSRTNHQTSSLTMCMCCANETREHVLCTNGHALCMDCVDKTVKMSLQQMEAIKNVDCPCVAIMRDTECSGFISRENLFKMDSGRKLILEVHHNVTMERVLNLVNRMRMQETDKDSMANFMTLRLQRLRADGTYRAYGCSQCGFGPIDHARCANLIEHHDRGGVNNACPKCGHFVSDVHDLVAWRDPI